MLDQAWEELPSPWLQAFELAWESYRAGSPPVGAVVLGPDGAVVARGRSRRSEGAGSAPPNHLAGSRLAHAEINALAQLPVDHHAGQWTAQEVRNIGTEAQQGHGRRRVPRRGRLLIGPEEQGEAGHTRAQQGDQLTKPDEDKNANTARTWCVDHVMPPLFPRGIPPCRG